MTDGSLALMGLIAITVGCFVAAYCSARAERKRIAKHGGPDRPTPELHRKLRRILDRQRYRPQPTSNNGDEAHRAADAAREAKRLHPLDPRD